MPDVMDVLDDPEVPDCRTTYTEQWLCHVPKKSDITAKYAIMSLIYDTNMSKSLTLLPLVRRHEVADCRPRSAMLCSYGTGGCA